MTYQKQNKQRKKKDRAENQNLPSIYDTASSAIGEADEFYDENGEPSPALERQARRILDQIHLLNLLEKQRRIGNNTGTQSLTEDRTNFLKDVLRKQVNSPSDPIIPKALVEVVLSDDSLFAQAQDLWPKLKGKMPKEIEDRNPILNFINKHKICK